MDKTPDQQVQPVTSESKQESHPNLKKGNIVNVGRISKASADDKLVLKVEEYLGKVEKQREKQLTLPTIEGLAKHLHIDDDTIVSWADKRIRDEQGNKTKQRMFPRFSAAIKRLKNVQKLYLMNDGLYGGRQVNVSMAIFLLKVNHGMNETVHTDVTSRGEPVKTIVGFNYLPPTQAEK